MPQKIIVTGANGQLGSEFRQIADLTPHAFIFTDIDSLDLTNQHETNSFCEKHKPDVIVNCAAYTAVDKAEEEPERAELINVGIPAMLAEYGKRSGCRIIHISTDYVFSGDLARPLTEEDPTGPMSRYGASKVQGEQAIMQYNNAMVIRTSWLYSSYGANFVKSMVRLLRERDELGIVFDQIGSPTYAADLAEAIMQIIGYGQVSAGKNGTPADPKNGSTERPPAPFSPGIYHYSNEGVASWYDLVWEIRELTGEECTIRPIETKDYPLPAPRPAYAVLNKAKIKNTYGLEIPYWKTSLKICLEKIEQVKQ
jgi:dTDP-4-dehydrorhamnose reductase